jgi:hypothetical protein
MGIEKVTQQQRFTNTDVIIGADSDKLDSGLSVYGKITTTDRISSRNDIYSDKNLIATGNVSATDVSVTGFLYVTGGIVAPGLTTEVSPDKIKTTNANLGDVLKVTDTAGVAAFTPSRVKVEELSADAPLILDGATISYDGDKKAFTAKNPEEAVVYESSYIKQLAKSTCVSSNLVTTAAYRENIGFASTTNDGRVIAWGYIPENIFSRSTTVTPYENIRVPFWASYDGYLSSGEYRPYGGDLLDSLTGTSIVDVYWSSNCAMALLTSTNPDYNGSVWTAGKNLTGTGIAANLNPLSLVKNKYDNLFILNNTAGTPREKLILLNAEKDVTGILQYTPRNTTDIILDKTNNDILSTESYYYIANAANHPSGNGSVDRINHFGEFISSHYSAVTSSRLCIISGIAMSYNDKDGKNLLYVCDTSATQSKIKVFDITNQLSAMPLISAIGTGSISAHLDADTEIVQPKFKNLKKIAIDPSNQNILYVIDEFRIKRVFRKSNGYYKVNTISDITAGNQTGIFSLATEIATARFTNPQAIAVSNDGKSLFIADITNKCIQKVTISENDESNFNGVSEYYVDTQIENPAYFSEFYGMTKDGSGNLYIADSGNNVIRKIEYNNTNKTYGIVTTYAGPSATSNFASATAAAKLSATIGVSLSAVKFNNPRGIAFSPEENALYITNGPLHCISRIDMALSSVSAIGSTSGYLSGTGLSGGGAQFFYPYNLCYGVSGGTDKYVWTINLGSNNRHYIKQIKILGGHNYEITNLTNTGTNPPSTPALTNAANASGVYLNNPYAIIYDNISNSLYFSNLQYAVQKLNLNDKKIYNVVGSKTPGNLAGAAGNAQLGSIYSLAISGDYLYINDSTNKKIWKLENFRSDLSATRILSEFIGGPGSSTRFSRFPTGLILGNDNDFLLQDSYQIKQVYSLSGRYLPKVINGVASPAKYKNTTYSTLDWLPSALFMDETNKLYFTEQKNDQAGYIIDKKLYPYKNMPAGNLGIGAGYNKTTCGFIKVNAEDAEGVPKFKRIQMVTDKEPIPGNNKFNCLFAALDTEDSLWIWGYSPDGAFGNGFIYEMGPTKIYQFDKNVKDFQINCATSAGSNRTLISIITKDNKLYTAGDNGAGQLGRNDSRNYDASHRIFRQCKKEVGGNVYLVDDAEKLMESSTVGYKNNYYISTLSTVWACGAALSGELGRGPLSIIKDPVFKEVDNLTNIKQIIGNLGTNAPSNALTIFALKDDGTLYSWGWNGANQGSTLSNNMLDAVIYTPTNCYNFETKDIVSDAKYIITNNDFKQFSSAGYIDKQNNLYVGGHLANVELPDLPTYTPYFRKFNMKNIMTDVCMINTTNIVRKSNGTVYTINSFGAKKVF